MKKLLLGLGTITAVVGPVAAVISCGDDSSTIDWAVGTPLDAGKQTILKEAANTTLGMDFSDIDSVAKATNYTFTTTVSEGAEFVEKSFTFKNAVIYNLKSSSTSFTINYGLATSTISTNGGGQVIVGMTETTARALASDPHFYILMKYGLPSIGGSTKSFNEITEETKKEAVKTNIIDVAFAPVEDATKVTLQLGTSVAGTPITWTSILGKIKADSNYDATKTTSVDLVIDTKTLTLTFAVGANDAALKTAMTNALTGSVGFTGCFDTVN